MHVLFIIGTGWADVQMFNAVEVTVKNPGKFRYGSPAPVVAGIGGIIGVVKQVAIAVIIAPVPIFCF